MGKAISKAAKQSACARAARWATANPERVREVKKAYRLRNLDRIRAEERDRYHTVRRAALDAYGGVCQCCGEAEEMFLAIDHVNGHGNEHRKLVGRNLYYELKKMAYPKGYQTLCHNCNAAKGFYGQCPHSMKQ